MPLQATENQEIEIQSLQNRDEDRTASPLDLPTETFRSGLDRRKANRAVLMEWIRAALVEGVDYGRIHAVGKNKCRYAAQGQVEACTDPKHWSKPILFKPGAEKICGMLGVSVHFPNLHEYEQAAIRGTDIKHIILRCEIRDPRGRVVADGAGARSLVQDNGDLNKALKMVLKSSMTDATLRMAGLSEVFTQDLEQQTEETCGPGIAESRLLAALKGYIDEKTSAPHLKNWGKRYANLVELMSEVGKEQLRRHYAARLARLNGGKRQPVLPFIEVLRLAKLAKGEEDREAVRDLARELTETEWCEIEEVLGSRREGG